MSLTNIKDLQGILLTNLAYELDKYEYLPIFLIVPILEYLPGKVFKLDEYIIKNIDRKIVVRRCNSPSLEVRLSTLVNPRVYTIHPFTSYVKKGMGGEYKPPRSIIPVAANKKIKKLLNSYISITDNISLPYAYMYLFFNRDKILKGEYCMKGYAEYGDYKFCPNEYSIKIKFDGMDKYKNIKNSFICLYDIYFADTADVRLPKFWKP
jgi:hypothetical protein